MAQSDQVRDASATPSPDLNLSITGIGREYPPYPLTPAELNKICSLHYPNKSPALNKVLAINQYTGIDTRSAIGDSTHPIATMKDPPSISELSKVFMSEGVPLAVTACRKALHEAQISPLEVTHVVSTTCTNSANPGFDHFVCKALGITQPVEKVLLHGIGCSGGLAALRTAANLALGSSFRRKRARILVVALEISSIMVRSELDSIEKLQECRIGITLFSDGASALVLSNGIEESSDPVYELLGWEHRLVPDTEADLGFDVDPLGWKVVLSPRVPKLATSIVPSTFSSLLESIPSLPSRYSEAAAFDWALHPGGATILSGVERTMSITPEHMRASYDVYMNHGNSSSATIISVLDRLRDKDMDNLAPSAENGTGGVKEFVVACAFGPGISIEMDLLRRNLRHVKRSLIIGGEVTPPETESEGSRSDGEGEGEELGERVKENGDQLTQKLKSVEPGVPEQNDSLSEALNGVDLD